MDLERNIQDSYRHISEAQARLTQIQEEKEEALAKAEKERLEKEEAVAKARREQLQKELERAKREEAEAHSTQLQQELEQARSAENVQVQADPQDFCFGHEGKLFSPLSDVFLIPNMDPMDPNFIMFEDDPIPNFDMNYSQYWKYIFQKCNCYFIEND